MYHRQYVGKHVLSNIILNWPIYTTYNVISGVNNPFLGQFEVISKVDQMLELPTFNPIVSYPRRLAKASIVFSNLVSSHTYIEMPQDCIEIFQYLRSVFTANYLSHTFLKYWKPKE